MRKIDQNKFNDNNYISSLKRNGYAIDSVLKTNFINSNFTLIGYSTYNYHEGFQTFIWTSLKNPDDYTFSSKINTKGYTSIIYKL